jgi:hypothetical protein
MAHHERHHRREIKERVLHTRVPEGLEIQLKRLADSLRVPVSNIVRAVLENALEAAEAAKVAAAQSASSGADNITERLEWMRRLRSYDDGSDMLVDSVDGNEARDSDTGNGVSRHHEHKGVSIERMMRSVIGFQPLTLAKSTRCAFCHREITPEQLAYVTVRERKGPKYIVGEECLPKTKNDRIRNEEDAKT